MSAPSTDVRRQKAALGVRRLESGYWHLRGTGPLNWAQPPHWPCDEATLLAHAFGQASEAFVLACLEAATDEAVGR